MSRFGIRHSKHKTQFTKWAKTPFNNRKAYDLFASIGGDFFKLLDGLSVARSRQQITKYYAEEMKQLGGFPRRAAPRAIHAPIDLEQRFLSFEQLDAEISSLRLALYHPSSFLRDDLPKNLRAEYEDKIFSGFTQQGRERILISMMKVNFLKRLESSVDSFRLTLQRTIGKIDELETRIHEFEARARSTPEYETTSMSLDEGEDPDFEDDEFSVGSRRRILFAHLKLPEWLEAITYDRTQLQFLLSKTNAVTPARDGKLCAIRSLIEEKVNSPTVDLDGQENRKVLVFTAFADTARYLYEHLSTWAQDSLNIHTGLVCGDGGNSASLGLTDYDDILTNFSPRSKRRADQVAHFGEQRYEIDLLIATDCISEGQNLQDCDLVVNYDIHWNPVRIIQRFGRVDRIGTRNRTVRLVNCWPVADLDNYLGVKVRVESRMALVDLAATQTDNLLDPNQLEELAREDLLFRDRQLQRLKEEVLGLDEIEDSVSLTDFSLDEFRLDLLRYLEANRSELEEAGEGLYAIVPASENSSPRALPGAIFCLRHRKNHIANVDTSNQPEETSKVNPLAPYYLIYIHDDGNVRFGFVQPKETMRLFRELAAGEATALEKLCELFDRRTDDGSRMDNYDRLIQKSLASIERTFTRRIAATLLSSRAAILPTSQETPTANSDDFDLVSWLLVLQSE